MAFNPRNVTPRLAARNHRVVRPRFEHDPPFTPTNLSEPIATRSGTHATRSNLNLTAIQPEAATPRVAKAIPEHYRLAPTVPSPFAGTLEASLDAILEFRRLYYGIQDIVEALLRPVDRSTNWLELLSKIYTYAPSAESRILLEELFFLVTRTLLPEQITENRAFMARLYDRKKQLAIRLVLRYDMLREWSLDNAGHAMAALSLPPASPPVKVADPVTNEQYPQRRPLMPNIWATLVAAPTGGYVTQGVRERMKHYITALDGYLLLRDKEVAKWRDGDLVMRLSQVVVLWQWLRGNNEVLEDMEVHGWEELEGKAEDCDWIADDVRRVDRIKELKKKDVTVGGVGEDDEEMKKDGKEGRKSGLAK